MATEAVENYIKAVYVLSKESSTGDAGVSRIAATVGVTPGTATTMVKRLARVKLARYQRFGRVRLTPAGRRIALDILRRHRLIETFLVRTLGLDWAIVHAEAERLEHAISPAVLAALDRYLGSPEFDPHGDPIPRADGGVASRRTIALSECGPGTRAIIAHVLDQREAPLRFLRRHGLDIGARITVDASEPGAGTVVVRNQRDSTVALGMDAASHVLVQPMEGRRARARRKTSGGMPRRRA